jgi:4-amino-4-deoxy-L-arabinose transferase-like glycosyltransferase
MTSLQQRTSGRFHWSTWHTGLSILAAVSGLVYLWALNLGQRSEYYAAIAVSMSQNWSNFFFGALDPAGTVTLDKIPGSYWFPALFVKVFGFSTWAIEAPNAIATVVAAVLIAVSVKRLAGPTAGLLAGAIFAATPIVAAVARSNQPQSFFLLTLALVLWSATRAIQRQSLGHLVLAGVWIGLAFQTYMLEAWAVWPALGVAYLFFVQKSWWQRIRDLAIAGATSLVVSLSWIFIVSLIPASSRPYIGGTYSNSAWEMVFGYNGLGRFSSTVSTTAAYRSFTPPFSGSPSMVRLFNEQLAGQIAWLIPTTILALVILVILKFNRALTVLLGVWFVTFAAMFSIVAGMHQFYTSALAVPMAAIIGVAFAQARKQNILWAQLSLIGVSALAAIGISFAYPSYLAWLPWVQLIVAVIAAAAILISDARSWNRTWWVALLAGAAMILTPAVWSVDTINHPSSINPMAGLSTGMGGGMGGGMRGGMGGGMGGPGQGQIPQGPPPGMSPGTMPAGGAQPGGLGSAANAALVTYVQANRGTTKYFLAVFGAQAAAPYITATGESVLPIGGFDGSDPVPTLQQFTSLVAQGDLRFVQLSDKATGIGGGKGGGMGGPAGAASQPSISTAPIANVSSEIQSWVTANCSLVSDPSIASSHIYDCAPAK